MKNNKNSLAFTFAIALGISALSATSASAQNLWNIFGFDTSTNSRGRGHANVQREVPEMARNLNFVDRASDEMLLRYSMESRGNHNCPKHKAFLKHMNSYNTKVNVLNQAARGKCTKTFKKAACDVRDNLTCLQKARKGLNVSGRVCSLISQSCPSATYIHKNASTWKPFVPVRYQQPQGPSCKMSNRDYSKNRGRNNRTGSGRGGYNTVSYGW